MSGDALPVQRPASLTADERDTRACDWADYRKLYGATPSAEVHKAFLAGWDAHRNGEVP